MAIKFLSGLNLSNITAGSILKLDSSGNIVAATAGTDYATSASAVWSTSGSNPTTAYYTGNVRVGTYQASVEASARLHVFDYQTTDPKLLIEDGNTGDASMQFKISTQQYTMGIDNSDSDVFKFSASSAFDTTNVFTVNTSGNVTFATDVYNAGIIRTRNSSYGVLSTYGSEGFSYEPVESSNAQVRYWLRFDYTNNASYPYLTNRTPNGAVVIKTGTAGGSGENEHFRIKGGDGTVDAYFTNVNLGIGTTSPDYNLHVVGSGYFTSNVRVDDYIRILGTGHNNTGQFNFNAIYDGGQTNTYTPYWSGATTAGMTVVKMPTGGEAGLDYYVYRHGTSTSSVALSSMTKAFSFNHLGQIQFGAYGAGLLKTNASGVISLDTNTYLTTTSASSTYLPLTGGTVANGNTAIPLTISRTTATTMQVGVRFYAEDGVNDPTDMYFGAGTDSEPYWATSANLSAGNMIWHEGNDGSGSGLDADLLDGNHASAFALASHSHSGADITSGTISTARLDTNVARTDNTQTISGDKTFTSDKFLKANRRVASNQYYPLGHYTPGETVFEIDPTWTQNELRAFFNSNSVSWNADSTAPGGYCIYIDGGVNVGGAWTSGFPYIPVDTDDIFYMECWIKNEGTNQGHYMGSIDYNESFGYPSSGSGNPGSYGYWVMYGYTGANSWTKVSGYISGFSNTETGKFETGTKYWTPQALFNYYQGTGTRACRISGWKVIKVNHVGNRTFAGDVVVSGGLKIGTNNVATESYVSNALSNYSTTNHSHDASDISSGQLDAARIPDLSSTYAVASHTHSYLPLSGGSLSGDLNLNYGYPRINFYDSNDNSDYSLINSNGSFSLYDITNNVHRLWVTSTGKVGIGTTSPEGGLHVASSSSGGIGGQIVIDNPAGSTLGNTAEISFLTDAGASGTGTRNARILAVNENAGNGAANMQFHTWNGAASAERMRITSGGNVGIGTDSPAYQLDVSGTVRFNSNAQVSTINGTNHVYQAWSIAGTRKAYAGFASAGTTAFTIYNEYNGAFIFGTNNTERMRITGGGDVGIGTTSPTSRLHIRDTASPYQLAFQSDTTTKWLMGNGTAGYYQDWFILSNGSTDIFRINGSYTNIRNAVFIDGSDNSATLSSGGSILRLANTDTTANNISAIDFPQSSSGSGFSRIGVVYKDRTASSEDQDMFFRTIGGGTSAEVMRLTSTGNVGIGTTTPDTNLEVVGNVHISGNGSNRLDLDSNVRISGQYYTNGGTEYTYLTMYNGSDASINIGTKHSLGYISFESGNGAYIERMRITNTGNVGIGTTSPGAKLDVAGDIRANSWLELRKDGAAVTTYESGIRWNYNGTNIFYFYSDNGDDGNLRIQSTNAGENDALPRLIIPRSNKDLYLAVSGGNVGIGTTSPAYKLDVSGPIRTQGIISSGATSFTKAFVSVTSSNGQEKFLVYTNNSAVDGYAHFKIHRAYDYGNNQQTIQEVVYQRRTTTKNVKWKLDSDINVTEDVFLEFYEDTVTGYVYGWLVVEDYAITSVEITYAEGTGNVEYSPSAGTPSGTLIYTTDADQGAPTWEEAIGQLIIGSSSTAFSDKLYVSSDAYTAGGWRVGTGATYVGKTYNSSGILTIESDGSRDIQFASSTNGTRMFIDTSAGNIGIGTSTPNAKLNVAGNVVIGTGSSRASDGLTVGYSKSTTYTANSDLRDANRAVTIINNQENTTNTYATLGFRVSPNTTTSMGDFKFVRTAANENSLIWSARHGTSWYDRFTIKSDGNVGIGTTSPTSKLHLKSSTFDDHLTLERGSDSLGISPSGGQLLVEGGLSPWSNINENLGRSDKHWLEAYVYSIRSGGILQLKSNGDNERMRIDASGNVGIGTTSPSSKLDVIGTGVFGTMTSSRSLYSNGLSLQNNSGQATSLFLWQAGVASAHIGSPANSTSLHIVNSYNTGLITDPNSIVLTNTGNVGIGTISPSQKLHVNGSFRVDGTAYSYASTNASYYNSGGNATFHQFESYWNTDAASSIATLRFDVGTWRLWSAGIGDSVVTVKSTGNVGIGTTSPLVGLDVRGTAIITNQSGTSYNENLRLPQATSGYAALTLGGSIAASGTSAAQWTILKYPTNNNFAIRNNNSDLLYITTGGNVGIGTTSPSYTLDVNGNARFSSTVTSTGFVGSLSGNATTATTLQTARTINGTSFNGSANITTANWGTARTITIGATGKSVNGSANVSWSLAEIGAQAAGNYWSTTDTSSVTVEASDIQFQALTVTFQGDVTVQGTFTELSSLRYKENIIDLEPVTDKVSQLRPVRYNKIGTDVQEIGLIAEEVAELFPEVVQYNEDGEPDSLNYTRLSVLLLQTVKELSDRIQKLENK